jgi:septum formation protein
VVPSPVDEQAAQRELLRQGPVAPPLYAERLAMAKALALAEHMRANPDKSGAAVVVVLGSDTIVELDGRILEKPHDESEAKEMLSWLSGREHLVHTGVALACVTIGTATSDAVSSRSFVDTAAVQFITLTPEDIDAYVSTGEPMDKAGSYGIQGMGGQMVKSITGDFFTVRQCDVELVCCLSSRPNEPADSPPILFFNSIPAGHGLTYVSSQPRAGSSNRGASTLRSVGGWFAFHDCRISLVEEVRLASLMLTADWDKAVNRVSRDVQKIFAVYLSDWTVTKLIFAIRRLMTSERPNFDHRC